MGATEVHAKVTTQKLRTSAECVDPTRTNRSILKQSEWMQQQCSLAMLTLFQSPKRFIRMVLLRFIFLGEGKDVFSLAARKKEEELTIESKSDSIFVMISLFFF